MRIEYRAPPMCVRAGTINAMEPRPLTQRERAVLEALLAPDFPGVEPLRNQVADVRVVGVCGCGCPSIDFAQGPMNIRVNASARGSLNGLFLYTVDDAGQGEVLGGIEWVGVSAEDPDELPQPAELDIEHV